MAQVGKSQFSTALRDLRLKLQMKPGQFAREIGVAKVTVYKFESGEVRPSAETIARVAMLASSTGPDLASKFWSEFAEALGTTLSKFGSAVGRAA